MTCGNGCGGSWFIIILILLFFFSGNTWGCGSTYTGGCARGC